MADLTRPYPSYKKLIRPITSFIFISLNSWSVSNQPFDVSGWPATGQMLSPLQGECPYSFNF